jgi:acyl-CoA thioesterase FadM
VTAGLRVDFRRPVPLHQPLTLNARDVASDDGRWHIVGELRHAGSDVVLATAEAVFIEQDESYFERLGGSGTPTA